jgi:hypothetical protein
LFTLKTMLISLAWFFIFSDHCMRWTIEKQGGVMTPAGALTLTTLPEHILCQIASHLDRSSAISLACTCSALQKYGETSAWTDLNLSLQRSYLARPLSYEWTKPLGGNRLYALRYIFTAFPQVSNPPEPGVIQSLALARLTGQLAELLDSHPVWRKAVRLISYDIDRLCSREFGRLLETVSSTLTGLELLPPDYPFGEHPSQGLFSPERLFRSLGFPLSSLRHLHLTINEQWEERIRSILPVVPNLQSLRLTPSMQYSAGWGQRVTFGPAVSGIDWPTLPSLRHLEIDEMHSVFSGMLEELVAAAPSLHHATFRDPDSEWQPKEDDPLLCALRRCSKLKYLGVSSLCARHMEDQGGFDSLEQLSLEQQDGSNEPPQLLVRTVPYSTVPDAGYSGAW